MNRRDLITGAVKVGLALALPEIARAIPGTEGIGSAVEAAQLIIGTNYAASGSAALSSESFPLFKNRMREGRGFTETGSLTTQVSLTSAGWPAGDFACVLWEGSSVPEWATAATSGTPMKCGFIGTGSETVATTSLGDCTIANVVHGTGGAYTTFDLYGITGAFGFQVTGTTGGVTNVFAYLPSYPAETIDDVTQSSAYTTEALAKYAALGGIRWMWPSNTVFNTGENTSTTRRTPSNTQSNQGWQGSSSPGQGVVNEGYPAEWCAYACKYSGPKCTAYFTLPVYEDGTNGSAGTYSNAVLTMINSVLIPAGNQVIIEIGNELWNTGTYPIGIGSGETINTLAVASGIASSDTDYSGCYKYLGYRLHLLANMCRTIFGSAFGTQVHLVLAAQGGNINTYLPPALEYMESNYGSPGADLSYLAIAPYVNLTDNSGDNSIAAVLSDLGAQGEVQPYQSYSEFFSILALRYGLKGLIAYEAGWQVNAEATGNAYIQPAIMNSGMEATMRDQVWKPMLDSGYILIFNFESGVSAQGSSGYSPVDQFSNDYSSFVSSGSPRFNAITDINTGGYIPQRNLLTSRGQTFSGDYSWDNTSGSPTGCTGTIGTSSYAWAQQFYVPAGLAGSYTPTVNVTGSASGATIEVNGTTVGTQALSAGNNILPSITLEPGFNYLMLYNGNGVSAVNSTILN